MRTAAGILLLAASLISIIQSIREIVLFEAGARRYEEQSLLERPFTFAGHHFTLEDDHPYIPPEPGGYTSEAGYPGTIRVLMDGAPLTAQAHAIVRPGRADLGRYHLWFDAWIFRNRQTGEQSLWLAQRLEEDGARFPSFEIITMNAAGVLERRRLHWFQLGQEYRVFRATQFISDGSFFRMPFSVTEALIFPPFLLLFPFGTLALGLHLLRRHGPRERSQAA